MAWTSAHFAMGMACGGALAAFWHCRRPSRLASRLPLAMTIGGLWAILPDMPRVFRVDFPSLGLAGSLGSRELEQWLHGIGDLFFFHKTMDAQPREFALHGLFFMLLFYNLACFWLVIERRRDKQRIDRLRTHIEAGVLQLQQMTQELGSPMVRPPALHLHYDPPEISPAESSDEPPGRGVPSPSSTPRKAPALHLVDD